ncbi:Short-chain dehydrogenase/reductase SDR [Ostreococcus tauri]|uniref:Short-chain dehydrogenase/reductase SDR n=1 Tax=Ostreococcus tauri TaxID=70448 RepID=Q011V6_OSTTA|nr:Short-chain dehydrogenase/reductase SDR [Ostreococcus tauri]CAL55324.1 Short-chain dehydrogenase/reductase SDR [Ostreococcus tauri]|eukprot:XP_003081155.1 Short-chain dehydrogenase/reductase SDR [Ostreococcus tauri]
MVRPRSARPARAFARAGRFIPLCVDLAPAVAAGALIVAPDTAVALRALAGVVLAACAASLAFGRSSPSSAFARASRTHGRGRVVWITGATQGLGEAMAMRYAELGATVIASGRDLERCEDVATRCRRAGASSAHAVAFDVSGTREEINEATRKAFAVANGVDVFVHCAGGSQAASALDGDDNTGEVDRALFQLNALGAIAITKEVAKAMVNNIRSGGDSSRSSFAPTIVGVCSAASKLPAPGQAVYAAAKSAYAAFLNSLRSEIADTGVRVTCAYPGPIATGMNGQERVVFRRDMASSSPSPGAAKKTKSHAPDTSSASKIKGRMPVDRVARDIIAAAAVGHDEIVLAPQPIMALTYFIRFAPTLAYAILDLVGPKRARKADAGENMYILNEK